MKGKGMFKDNILTAIMELKVNKMRSFLTMLGIVIGIASVIAIMTVGESMNVAMQKSMNEMGAGNIEFYIVPKNQDDENAETREMKDKDYADEKMVSDIESRYRSQIRGIALSTDETEGIIPISGKDVTINLLGVNEIGLQMNKLNIIAGRNINDTEFTSQPKVVIISSKLAEKLYGNAQQAVGNTLECLIEDKYQGYTIVGVYEHKNSANDFDSKKSSLNCYMPIKTVLSRTGQPFQFSNFIVIGNPNEDAESLMNDIMSYVNRKYYASNDAYCLDGYNMKDWIQENEKMINTMKLAMSAIAAISLLVGGIGVMNILIVSITERTREIGIRKALGATNASIRMQFITESIVMCVIGGILGIITGVGLGMIASGIMHYPGVPPIKWIVISVLFSMAFGIFFGLYPANKAAKMNPIDALRYE